MTPFKLTTLFAAMLTANVWAQGTAPAPSSSNPAVPSPPAAGSTGVDRGMGTGASAKPGSAASLAKADGTFVKDAAAANKAEVALGNLAVSKGTSPAVKQFGQHMVTDHTKAYDELAQVASGKGVPVPTEPTAAQKSTAAKLARMSGPAFDKEFSDVMVTDHKKTVALFKNESTNGRDADLKAWAGKTLPTLEEHLKMAQTLQTETRKMQQ